MLRGRGKVTTLVATSENPNLPDTDRIGRETTTRYGTNVYVERTPPPPRERERELQVGFIMYCVLNVAQK